jgi:hypothetical protein
MAQKMNYHEQHVQEIYDEFLQIEGLADTYEDVMTGSAYLDAIHNWFGQYVISPLYQWCTIV